MSSGSDRSLDPYSAIDRLADEFAERYRRGERPSVEEYTERYPELADAIRDLFPALVELGQAEQGLHQEPPVAADPPVAPSKIGEFRILREVGRGGMGVVYEAEQTSLGRRVALKVLPRHAVRDRTALERFRREARSAARLHHTNIVPVYEVGQDGDVCYYAMQFIDGQGLDAVIHELRRLRDRSGTNATAALTTRLSPRFVETERDPSQPPALSHAAQSLLTGRFTPGANTPRDDSTASGVPKAPSGPVPRDEWPDPQRTVTPDGGNRAQPAAPDDSAAATTRPGSSQLSSVDSGDREYYRSVARIGRQVAQGLGYAHARGVIHRDIKPSNLLLDTEGIVWITDFGLAKTEDHGLTRTGDILGTLRYMAPERFRGEGDRRADLYALGLTLYELLTLRPAFDSPDRLKLIEQIKSHDPPRPRERDPHVPRDLETIVVKASDKDPDRRYATAEELAEDLRRFLAGEPIRARQVGELERAWKWAKRRPALSASLALLAASLVVGTVVSVSLAIRANAYAERADDRTRAAVLAQRQAQAAQGRAEQAELASALQSAGLLLDRGLALAEAGEIGPGLHWMLQALRTVPNDAAEMVAVIRANISAWARRLTRVRWMLPVEPSFRTVQVSPDGRRFAMCSTSGIRIHDAATGEPVDASLELSIQVGSRQPPFAYSHDGKYLIVGLEDALYRLDAETLRPVGEPLPLPSEQLLLRVRPDNGILLAIDESTGRVQLVDTTSWVILEDGGPIASPGLVHVLPDGRLVTGRYDAQGNLAIELLDAERFARIAGPWMQPPPNGDRFSLIFWPNPDGRSYWCRARPGWVQEFGMSDGQPISPLVNRQELRKHDVLGGMKILPGGWGFLFQQDGEALTFLPAEPPGVASAFDPSSGFFGTDPDGRWLLATSNSFVVRKDFGDDWPMIVEQDRPGAPVPARFEAAWYTPDREAALLAGWRLPDDNDVLELRETATNRPRGPGVCFTHDAYSLRFPAAIRADGQLAAAARGMTIRLFDPRNGRTIGPPMRHNNTVSCLAFSPDGSALAAGDYGQSVILWNVATGRPARPVLMQPDIVWTVDFRPDGRVLAVGTGSDRSGQSALKLWDLASGAPVGPEVAHPGYVAASYSPDGSAILTTYGQGLRFFDGRTGRPMGTPIEFPGERIRAGFRSFSADGRRVLVGTSAGRARLFDTATGTLVPGKVYSHPDGAEITALVLSLDRRTALLGHVDGNVRLWDAATARTIGPPVRLGSRVIGVAFSPDGQTALATTARGSTYRWPVPHPVATDTETLALGIELETGQRLEPGPSVVALSAREWLSRRDRLRRSGQDRETLLTSRPSGDEWHTYRAHVAEEAGAREAAIWHLEHLARSRPDDWAILARMGAHHAEAGRYDRAAETYQRAERMAGAKVLTGWYRHCVAGCLSARRFHAARWYLDRILEREADDAHALADRAAARAALGDAAGAESDQARAATLADDPDLLVSLGTKLARTGRWDKARVAFARAAESPTLTYLDRGRTAAVLALVGDEATFSRLVDQLLVHLDTPPGSPIILLLEASPALLAPLRPAQAERLCDLFEPAHERLKQRPNVPAILLREMALISGAALFRAGRHAEAVARLEESAAIPGIQADPRNDAYLALAHHALGHEDEARRHLDRLIAAPPSENAQEDLEVQALRREAEALIRFDAAFPKRPFAPE
jgi:serine/threonine protein kinase/WD40 repeat protein